MTANSLDYRFLLLTHIVCADQQIHSEESKALHELATNAKVGQTTLEEMEKILAQDEHHLSLEEIARKVPPGQQSEAMRQILAIAYVDGYFSPLEREIVQQIAQNWNWSGREVTQLLEEAEGFAGNQFKSRDRQDTQQLSFGARLLRGANTLLSRELVNHLTQFTPENIGLKIEQLQREILLTGSDYDEAIQQCSTIASEDYKFVELALKRAYSTLQKLGENLQTIGEGIQQSQSNKGTAKTSKEVIQQLEATRSALTAEIIKDLESVRESLNAKQRALNHFSIAFMGKTKVGKSTLHAIITGEGWDAIGVGKQRTTRFNRVYEWKNIRIIDTPGIGAPGGKTDEEIARSIIEESDAICYVVTNDSIQETEFQFLKHLKAKAKPLIVLLNVKHNLCDSRRLEHFLKNPEKLFAREGNSSLGGHIDRIRRYAKQHYANDYFDIIPVMLLAAQMSRESQYQDRKDKLFKASRIQDFLDSIRESLVKYGAIRRSQTFLGSTVGEIEKLEKWVTQEVEVYQKLATVLNDKHQVLQKDIEKAARDTRELLKQKIEEVFQDVLNSVPSFAENHWSDKENELKQGWEEQLKLFQLEERLQTACKEASEQFGREVREAIEEIGHELKLISQLRSDRNDFQFTRQDSDDFLRNLMRLGGGTLGIVGTIVTFFIPPLGLVMGIIGGAASLLTGIFKSKEQKRREAVNNISISLRNQINKQKQTTLTQLENNFDRYCQDVAANVNVYFNELLEGLAEITTYFNTAKRQLCGTSNYLNRAYAKRIIDWCRNCYEPLTDSCIRQTVSKVERKFGQEIKIYPKFNFDSKRSQAQAKEVLQEDIYLIRPN